jgi:hypothetical protein
MTDNPYQSPIEITPAPPARPRLAPPEPWYLLYPASSFLALVVAAAVTLFLWVALFVLGVASSRGDAAAGILVWLDHVAIVASLATITWFFRTGAVSSMMIAFVMWCHLGMIGIATVGTLVGGEYEGAEQGAFLLLGVATVALPAALLQGALVGLRRRRAF